MATFLPPCYPTRLNASLNQLGDGFGHTSRHKTKLHGTQPKTAAVRPQQTQAVEKSSHQVSFKMSYPKIKTTKRDVTAKELAERFNCSTRTVFVHGHNLAQTTSMKTASAATNHGNNSEYLVQLGTDEANPLHPPRINMKYLIKSTKGYWLEKGHGYTQSQNEAYAFTLEEMLHLGFNLDGCTLLKQS